MGHSSFTFMKLIHTLLGCFCVAACYCPCVAARCCPCCCPLLQCCCPPCPDVPLVYCCNAVDVKLIKTLGFENCHMLAILFC